MASPSPALRVAFVGATPAGLANRVRPHLKTECEFVLAGEKGVVGVLPDVDVLVTFVFTREMGAAARRLKLLQVPGAGLDRIGRSSIPEGSRLANAYGHENGIARGRSWPARRWACSAMGGSRGASLSSLRR